MLVLKTDTLNSVLANETEANHRELLKRKANTVFGLGVFSMVRRHALVSLRHAAPPSAMLPLFFFLGLILL